MSLVQRADLPVEHTWNLEAVYEDISAWEADFATLDAPLRDLAALRGRLGEGPVRLLEAVALIERIWRTAGKLRVYASAKHDQDTADPTFQTLMDRVRSRMADILAAQSFVRPELLALPEDRVRAWLAEEPELALWRRWFDELWREAPHVRSAGEERVLAALGEAASAAGTIRGRLTASDLDHGTIREANGDEVPLTSGTYGRFMLSPDRTVRRAAYERYMDGHAGLRNTLAASYVAHIRAHARAADLRGHRSARAAALHGPDIPESVYDLLVDTAREHVGLLHRYYALRRQALGVERLRPWDLRVALGDPERAAFDYEQAKALTLAALAPLGDDYVQQAQRGLDGRWVDVFATPNKRGGAYSGGSFDTAPFILLNYQPGLDGLFTLAHEMGHSMHSLFSRRAQPWAYAGYPTFVAEVASTLAEDLLMRHMLAVTEDPLLRLTLIDHHLVTFRSTFFRQVMFAEFERDTYAVVEAGGSLTADDLESRHRALSGAYHGPAVALDDRMGTEWSIVPHFFYNFYVFQYATGLAAATALGEQLTEEGESAARRVRDFLSSGRSASALDLLRTAGVDMATRAPLDAAMAVFARRLDDLESLLASAETIVADGVVEPA